MSIPQSLPKLLKEPYKNYEHKDYDDIELEGEDYEIIGIVAGMFKKCFNIY